MGCLALFDWGKNYSVVFSVQYRIRCDEKFCRFFALMFLLFGFAAFVDFVNCII